MSKPLAGIRILEVAAWTFVPAAGASGAGEAAGPQFGAATRVRST